MQQIAEQFVIDSKGKKKAAIISIARYRALMEDLHDLAIVAERKNEPSIPIEKFKEKLKKDGLL